MFRASASLVVYRTSAAELQQLFAALRSAVGPWILVDNSPDQEQEADARRSATEEYGGVYLSSPRNVGFGEGHNLAMAWLRNSGCVRPFHLIVNPDILFAQDVIERLTEVLEDRPEISWIMPQVRSDKGEVQPLCKLLPTPLDLLGRRFLPRALSKLFGLTGGNYEMKGIAETPSEDVPFLSGCFILARRTVLQQTGGFDPSYFLYMEDVDLCRRFREHGKLLYWPEVHVVHGHRRGSYHSLRLTLLHMRSAFRYFRRWGWFHDPARKAINAQALRSLGSVARAAAVPDRKNAESVAGSQPSRPAHR